MEARHLKTARSAWERTLIVCGKCSKKVDGGFGPKGRTPLGKAMRRYLGLGKGRKARIGFVEVRCLGICPKNAVVVIDAADPGVWQVVPAGMPLADVAASFGLLPVDVQTGFNGAVVSTATQRNLS